MNSAIIVSAVRTPIAISRKGSLVHTNAEFLARTVLEASIARAGIASDLIDDVVFAESLYGGGALARHAAVEAGLMNPAGTAVNRHCAGSLTSLGFAAASIVSGMERAVVAGGVQSFSTSPQMRYRKPGAADEFQEGWSPPTHPNSPEAPNRDMSISVGWNTAKEAGLTREEMDAWAVRSHQRAITAIDAGHFVEEIEPVPALQADGSRKIFSVDEYPRRDSSLEKMAALKVLHPEIEGFSITAGNSSGINDAAAALVVASDDLVRAEGLQRLARVRAWTAVGITPARMGLSVLNVIPKLLNRAGLKQSDVALWEINEAFASVPLAACRKLGIDEATVNISGSGCSLGHPVAASGARMVTTLIHDLKRR
ncbi:MAG: thiolase family protein, partial [Hyphomonadaceae bacterium]|nr:thiolase family protein [Hyphomonadaceae bacterium]